ncbi:hypothetical protein ACLB2K_030008 [Fragaria x ananassa]
MNNFIFDQSSIPSFPDHNPPDQFEANHELTNLSFSPANSYPYSDFSPSSSSGLSSEGVNSPDDSNTILRFISEMLMQEEDLENKPCMLQDCLALRAAEKSLYDVLVQEDPSLTSQNLTSTYQNVGSPDDVSNHSSSSSHAASNWVDSDFDCVQEVLDTVIPNPFVSNGKGGVTDLEGNSSFPADARQLSSDVNFSPDKGESESRNGSRSKKNRYREDGDYVDEERSYKQSAVYADEAEQEEIFDQVLLCQGDKSRSSPQLSELQDGNGKQQRNGKAKGSKAKKKGKKKPDDNKEMVDLQTLLTQCAQAVASFDKRNATDKQLKLIRQHSSPYGDGTQRLAHYMAKGLEERLTAAVSSVSLYKQSVCFSRTNLSAADILKAYQTYITACPFKKMSNFYANRTIVKLAEKATRLHIIDFGILYGYQWPCLIQALSKRPGGPPIVRITGIEFPQSGFRPSERLEETGRRLQNYCKRFNVPFQYTAIAKNWETIQYEDIKIDRDELTVVNCMDREDQQRLLFEQEIFGRDLINVVACEGSMRLERPETYKQWQIRNKRAGFKQLPLDQDILKKVRTMVKSEYHKDFVVDEDGRWVLQGWKGRIIQAISCWKSA